MKNFIIPQDQNARLHGTIIRYDGKPYYVVVSGPVLHLYRPSKVLNTAFHHNGADADHKNVDPYDNKVDVSSIELGYVNKGSIRSVMYMIRRPLRRFQQGLSEQTTFQQFLPEHIKHPEEANFMNRTRDTLYSQDFEDMVSGKYPSLDLALTALREWQVKDGRGEVAVTQDIALSIDGMGIIRVYYKNSYVGWIAPNKKTVNVPSNDMGWIVSQYLSGLNWEIN